MKHIMETNTWIIADYIDLIGWEIKSHPVKTDQKTGNGEPIFKLDLARVGNKEMRRVAYSAARYVPSEVLTITWRKTS